LEKTFREQRFGTKRRTNRDEEKIFKLGERKGNSRLLEFFQNGQKVFERREESLKISRTGRSWGVGREKGLRKRERKKLGKALRGDHTGQKHRKIKRERGIKKENHEVF